MPDSWLYRIKLAMDANFRLANKLTRSTNVSDPYLTQGKAYMAPPKDYDDHLTQMEKAQVPVEPVSDVAL